MIGVLDMLRTLPKKNGPASWLFDLSPKLKTLEVFGG